MRINRIYISAFGGLKDFTLELEEGFNVVYGENENGKSTVMAFIKMMFYGSGKKTQQLANSPRVKYTPWNGDSMGGRIYFEHNEKRYCLEREFKRSDSTDRILLTDLDSGESTTAASDIGNSFFGISAAAFERSVFIGSTGGFSCDENALGEINSRLSNLVLTGQEDTSYQAVLSNIEQARTALISKSGRTGTTVKDKEKLEDLKERLQKADTDARSRSELDQKMTELKSQYESIKVEHSKLSRLLEMEADIRNAEKLKEYLNVKSSLDELNDGMRLNDGKIIDELFVRKIKFCLNRISEKRRRINELEGEYEGLKETIRLSAECVPEAEYAKLDSINQNIDTLKKEISTLDDKLSNLEFKANDSRNRIALLKGKKNPAITVLSVLGAALAAIGLTSGLLLSLIPGIITSVVGIIIIILALTIVPKNPSISSEEAALAHILNSAAEFRNQKADTAEKINNLQRSADGILNILNTDSAVKSQREDELNKKEQLILSERESEDRLICELIGAFSPYSKETDTAVISKQLESLEIKTEQQKQLKIRLGYLSSDLGNISYEQARQKLDGLPNIDSVADTHTIERAKTRLSELNSRINEITSALSAGATQIKMSLQSSDDPQTLRREISELNQKIKHQQDFYDAAVIAAEVLNESFSQIRRGYGAQLEKKTLEIFSRLTNGRYGSINISKSFEMMIEQSGSFGTRELEYLSSGTIDQAYLSLRLAVSALMCEGESLPVMLDDSLSQYDDRRTEEAISFLKEYCTDGQTILFTCHTSICKLAEKYGLTVTNLKKNTP